LEKTISKMIGCRLIIICALTASTAFGQSSNAQDRALQARIDSCNNAIAKYKTTKQEVDRANAERLCKHSTPEPKKVQAKPQSKPQYEQSQIVESKPASSGISFWVIVLLVLAGVSAFFKSKKSKYRQSWRPSYNSNKRFNNQQQIAYQSEDHLSITLRHTYEKKRLLNRSEEKVYKAMLQIIYSNEKNGFKISMQPSLGEILNCEPEGHKTINSKRVDFCIVDRNYMPVAVIEVNGSGHYQGDALERDEVKRAAIESAGIKYIALRENENINDKLVRELGFLFKPAIEKIIN